MAVSITSNNCTTFQNTAKKHLTTTGKYHRFIPNIPQEFDCRVKANIKKESVYKDIKIKDEEYQTLYLDEYTRKIVAPTHMFRPPRFQNMNYIRNVEEKLFINPPRPLGLPLSEMKNSYQQRYPKPSDKVEAPCKNFKCNMVKLGFEQQPSIPTEKKGFWKWSDPYLTTSKSDYVSYGDEVDSNIKGKILTYYNASDFSLPSVSGNKTMFDKKLFKNVLPLRWLSRLQKRVPHFGMQSEYQGHYIKQTFSDCYPSLHDNLVRFEDSLPDASRYQNLPAPGMYCSEYCILGGKAVRSVVDISSPKRQIIHTQTEKCSRIY